MAIEEGILNEDGLNNPEELSNSSTNSVERANDVNSDDREEVLRVTKIAGESKRANRLMLFFLLTPIVFIALFYEGSLWLYFYLHSPDILHYHTSDCIPMIISFWVTVMLISPLYVLLALWRLLLLLRKKRLSITNKTISSTAVVGFWVYFATDFFRVGILGDIFEEMLNLLHKKAGAVFIIVIILFFSAVVFKACFVILDYYEIKYPSKKDLIFCTGLFAAYLIICKFIIYTGRLANILM